MKLAVLLSLVAVVILGCDDAGTTRIASQGASCDLLGVVVSPASVTIFVGDSTQLTAKAPTCGLPPGSSSAVRWRSSNAAAATVDSLSGIVRGVSAGQLTIIGTLVSDTLVKGAAVVAVNSR
jgi:uncharacterized protein YjdB